MKKTAKRILCIMLAVLMLSGTCVSLAASAKDYSGYNVYVVLGDSIAAGIGETNKDNKFLYRTPGAYPDIIANTIGAHCIPLCCAGSRTVELRACLEDDYVMPDHITMTMGEGKVEEIRDPYIPAIKRADIITLNIGANDIATYALLSAKDAAGRLGISFLSVNDAVSMYEENGDATGAITKLVELADKVGAAADMVNAVITGLYVGYDRFCENWECIMRDIYTLNPDVTMLVAGMYNPFNRVKLTSNSLIEIGRALDGVIKLINARMQYGSHYSKYYTYVDIMGIESLWAQKELDILDEGFLKDAALNVHPSVKGQSQIAEKMIAKIPEKHMDSASFTDLDGLDLEFRGAVNWAYNKGITVGRTAEWFDPDWSCNRAEIITMLWRAAGCPEPKSAKCVFPDVNPSSYCAKPIQWAYEQGITNGYETGDFAPADECTRAQIVTFLYRYAGSPTVKYSISFEDVFTDDYFYDAVAWAVKSGITNGCDSTHFCPFDTCTRAQAVTFLYRYMG